MPDIIDSDRKCALYVRVSTVNQAEDGESLDEQVRTLENYCAYRKWLNPVVYREEGFSGKNLKRPAFQQMMRDIDKGKINTVIVKKIDRLSRSIMDFEGLYTLFQESNVDLISTQENFDTSTAIGRSVIRIVLIFAQLEREQTSERTIDVMAYRARQGMFNGGYPRLGYDIDYEKKCLVPNPREIPILQEVFSTYCRLGSLSETANELNAKGYRLKSWVTSSGKSRGGEKFQKNSVSRILNDPIYLGKTRYKKQVFDGQHPAILSEELYEAAQEILQKNNATKTGYRQNDNTFLLKGLVKCQVCGSAMAPSFALSKGKKYFYYRCVVDNDKSKRECRVGSVHARKLEELVVDELKHLTKDPRIIEGVVEQASANQRLKINELSKKKAALQDMLVQTDRKAKNLVGVLSETGGTGVQTNYIIKEIEALEGQSKQLKSELEIIDFEANEVGNKIVDAEIILENLKVFRDIFDHLTVSEQFDLLHLLIKKIVYYEGEEKDQDGKKVGKMKMDLWELPPLDPSKINPANGFAESIVWLPSADSNHGHGD